MDHPKGLYEHYQQGMAVSRALAQNSGGIENISGRDVS